MNRIEKLREKVRKIYERKDPNRADWADWIYENHVFFVADKSRELAKKFGAKPDIAEAAALLHDIADAVMSRFDPAHEEVSLEMARKLLEESEFNEEEKHLIVEKIIKLHGCHGDKKPEIIEGEVMTTADGLGHLCTGFYDYGVNFMKKKGETDEQINKWVTSKTWRDFNEKIQFDEIREETRQTYEAILRKFKLEN